MKNDKYPESIDETSRMIGAEDTDWFTCLDVLEGLSRMTYRSFCIVDYMERRFLYVSDNTLSMCGRSPEEIISMGSDFYTEYVPEEDLKMISLARDAAAQFLETIPKEEKYNYILSYDFHIKNAVTDIQSLINHKYTPLKITEDGKVKLAICLTSMSPHSSSGIIEIMHKNRLDYWIYDLFNKNWKKKDRIVLKKEEKEVIKLSAQGFSISDMAEHMNKSFDTIKFYRKSLFRKLEVDSITEALSQAVCKRLL